MDLYIYLIIFTLGLIFGSFLNVVIYRLKNGGTIVSGRSKCPHCKKILGFFDLFPVLSFVSLKGKCRFCKKKISWQYPLVELSSALILVFVYANLFTIKQNFSALAGFNDYLLFAVLAYIFLSLFVILVYDQLYYLIPDVVLVPSFLVLVIFYLSSYFLGLSSDFLSYVLGMLIYSGFFAIQYFISKGKWVGFGDIKLGLLLGLLLGWQLTLVSLFLAYVFGSLVALALIGLKKKTRKDIIPFGPFLIASAFFCFFYGNLILDWYLGLILK